MRLRLLATLTISLALLTTTACGGGGGGGAGGGTGTSTLSGRIVTRNGSTSNLGGISVTFLRTGQTVTSNPNGSFGFGTVPTGTISLRVDDPALSMALVTTLGTDDGPGDDNGDDGNDDDFDDGDDNDTGDDDCDVPGGDDGESIEVFLSVDGGVITSIQVSRSSSDDRESESRLTRAATSDDGDVEGEASLESRTDRQKLKVEAEHLTTGRSVRAVVICDGVEASLGDRTVDSFGEAEWEIATNDGGVLPHAAATVEDLVGCDVEVRDATNGTVLLFGTFESVPASSDDDDGDGDDDDGGTERLRGRAVLTKEFGVAGKAYCEIERRTDGGTRNEFKVEVEDQTAGLVVDVLVANPVGGALTHVGSLTVGSLGEGELELESQDGDSMPFGVTDVTTLSGLAIELRDAGGTVLWTGTVPTAVVED
jgi:hypothetical protein